MTDFLWVLTEIVKVADDRPKNINPLSILFNLNQNRYRPMTTARTFL